MGTLRRHAIRHGIVLLGIFLLWVAAESLARGSASALLSGLCLLLAALAGLTAATLIHEWFHFAGAELAGADYSIPEKTRLFVFDYDYQGNSMSQFNVMSWTGQAGGWLTVALLWLLLPATLPGTTMVVAGAMAGAVFASAIEWPVLWRARSSGDPFAELSKINLRVLLTCLGLALVSGYAVWALF